ncbi:MAG: L-aspartate oxidase [Planctomycetota bacterium]|nr:MAG: L-aspartate oxidase [Planctomycetota bacterium]
MPVTDAKQSLFREPIRASGPDSPRYVVEIDPKRMANFFTDVLIIGGGLAGLRAANAVGDASALVITKDEIRQSNSNYAQGGIASVWGPDDRFESHVEDTLRAGGSLCHPEVVEMVVRDAPERVRELIEWGTQFDRQGEELALGREGGHSHQRIIHALGDATGREIMRAVIERTRALENVAIWERAFTIDLISDGQRCYGAVVLRQGQPPALVWAQQTILCTGGCGQAYRETTNPPVATGDGHALAFRAGARVRDMEFMQFHPTVLYIAGSSRTLVTEAIRGAGAHLVDCHGYRFMQDYDSRLELAPRDVVSQAIVRQMARTQHPCVYLSLRHMDPQVVQKEFPGFAATCKKFGLDPMSDPIPVRPGAHYMIGGVETDIDGRTSLEGLWAAGEVTSSGLHGANRLASNSLLEGLVFGARAGERAAEIVRQHPHPLRALPIRWAAPDYSREPFDIVDIRNSVKSLMWRSVGVERHGEKLREALHTVRGYSRYVLQHAFDSPEGWELQNLLTVAAMMIEAALVREESRGVHLRVDFPETDDQRWRRHIVFQRDAQS